MTVRLSVNVNAIAQLRNRRDLPWPSVTGLSRMALDAGAYGITVHPRPDQRHIRTGDVHDLSALLKSDYDGKEFNIEGYPSDDFLALVEHVKPDQATLVPDEPGQATSDHGWNVAASASPLASAVALLKRAGIRVSLFVDADPAAARAAKGVGADRIELYTGPFGALLSERERQGELAKLKEAAEAAREAGLGVNAGHDLTVANLPELVAAVPFIAEVSIGHAVTADALEFGMAEAVRRFRNACGDPVR